MKRREWLLLVITIAWALPACGSKPTSDTHAAPAQPATSPEPAATPSASASAPAPHPHHSPEYRSDAHDEPPDKFADAARWSKVFDDPKRDAWQKPDEVVRELGLKPNAVVADLGAGTGYFSVRLARAVPKGRVLAIDLTPGMLDWTKKRAERAGVTNVQTILAEKHDPKLPKGVDLVLVVDTYHHITDRVAYFHRVLPLLNAGARVVVVDFKMGKLPVGPPDGHKIPREAIESEMTRAGYQLCRSWDGLPYHHVLFFGKTC